MKTNYIILRTPETGSKLFTSVKKASEYLKLLQDGEYEYPVIDLKRLYSEYSRYSTEIYPLGHEYNYLPIYLEITTIS